LNRSGNEIGPFRAIEESIVAHLTPAENRGDIYAWYSLLGPAGTAVGLMAAGWLVHHVEKRGWPAEDAYRLVFVLYSALGLVKLAMVLCMSSRSEAEAERGEEAAREAAREGAAHRTESGEEEPLLGDDGDGNGSSGNSNKSREGTFWKRILSAVDRESMVLVGTLCFLFGLDSFASGMAPL